MKLSSLVHYKNALSKMSVQDIQREAEHGLNLILYLVQNQQIQLGNLTEQLAAADKQIHSGFDNFQNLVDALKNEISNQIAIQEKHWFQESYSLYDIERKGTQTDYVLNRRLSISDEARSMYQTRLSSYADWRYPGMVIRPALEDYVKSLVSYDPLYLVDQSHDLLTPAVSQFTEDYQRRLRPYTVDEISDGPYLEKIPADQFGFVFAYNFFNFRPFEVIKQYLAELYTKLRPGGILIFTFNDCDNDKAVQLVEQYFCCYTPGTLLKELVKTQGYEIVFTHNDGGPSSWIEVRKPGKLDTIRGGQTLAKIMPKSL